MNYVLHAIDDGEIERKALLITFDDLISIYFSSLPGFRLLIMAAERINSEPKCCISNEVIKLARRKKNMRLRQLFFLPYLYLANLISCMSDARTSSSVLLMHKKMVLNFELLLNRPQ